MRKNLVRVGAVVAGLALLAAACGDDDDNGGGGATTTAGGDATTTTAGETTTTAGGATTTSGGGTGEGMKIGALLPETGALSAIVQSLRVPIDIAVEEINDAGGVLGQPVTVVGADDGTNGDVLIPSVDRLIESDRVNVIVGPAPSGAAANIIDKIKTGQVPTCSGSTTSAELSTVDSGGFFFRTAPPDRLQGPALAELVLRDGHTRVGIIVRNDTYGVGLGDAIEEAITGSGGEVTAKVAYDPSGTNFDGDVQQVLNGDPEAIVVIGFNDDGGKIISTLIAQNAGPSQKAIYTADGMQGSSFFEAVDASNPAAIDGIRGTAPAASPAGITHPFQEKFAGRNVDPIFSSYYYDCTNLLALAAEKAGSLDGEAIAAAFAENLQGDVDCQTFPECKEALDNGDTIHYRGASNTFDVWDEMEPGTGVYEVWEYADGGKVNTLPADQQISIGG